MDWSDGYVTDVGYTYGCYKELNPLLQSFCLAVGGREAPDIKAPFVKVELGCGYGLSLLIEAAAYPHSQFFGLDFNPNHITWASRIAAEAGLDNITFFDSSFADLLTLPIPSADFIGLHGVWSWISQENREAILRFLAARLKNGGVTMASYNVLPGWSELQSLREVMMRKYRSSAGTSEARVTDALNFARALAKVGGPLFNQHPILQKTLDDLGNKPIRYLAHEYFNQDWHLFYQYQVSDSMSKAKLSYCGTSKPVENFERLCIPQNVLPLLDQVSPPERETLKDLYNNRNFRYDLYGRGIEKGQIIGTVDRLKEFKLVLINHDFALDVSSDKTAIAGIKLKNAMLAPIIELLKQGPVSGLDMAIRNGVEVFQPGPLSEIMAILVESGIVSIALPAEGFEARRTKTHRLNEVLLNRFGRGEDIVFLASPVSGLGHNFNDIDKLFLSATQLGKDAAAYAWQILQPLGRRLILNGTAIDNDKDSIAELNLRYENYLQKTLPQQKHLGLL